MNPIYKGMNVPNSNNQAFDERYEETHEADSDVDECIEDDYSGKDFE